MIAIETLFGLQPDPLEASPILLDPRVGRRKRLEQRSAEVVHRQPHRVVRQRVRAERSRAEIAADERRVEVQAAPVKDRGGSDLCTESTQLACARDREYGARPPVQERPYENRPDQNVDKEVGDDRPRPEPCGSHAD